jgi:16S rRNA (cytosine1402-N4)-methyltransferase
MDLPESGHDPVLLRETIDHLALAPGKTIVDGTTGRGGHSRAIAERLGPAGTLLCLDVDPRNLEYARARLAGVPCRIRFFHANFAELPEVLHAAELTQVDGMLADLGISTNQLFEEQYGLSFAAPMPLDMRVDPRIDRSAADLVNRADEETIANLLFNLADERYSRRIARKIGEARRISPIQTTDRLADVVRSAIPRSGPGPGRSNRGGAPQKIDPATRTFLALRMAVNREVENLQSLLEKAPRLLAKAGRFAVISFHSTEDRLVKQAFRSAEQTGVVRLITPKPISPADDELAANPRSRSAKLRVAERL